MSGFATVEEALKRIRRGEMVLVTDDEDRENEGDLTLAAEWVTPEAINFMLRWARGLVCMPIDPEYLERLDVTQLVLEYATDRAGDVTEFRDKELGLGVVNPRTDAIESIDAIVASVERARSIFPASRIFLNPDCGFGTFSNRPVNVPEIAAAKLCAVVAAARTLRS